MTNSSNKLTSNEAQKLMLVLLANARTQIDVAARAPLARDRTRAMQRLNRAIALLSDAKRI